MGITIALNLIIRGEENMNAVKRIMAMIMLFVFWMCCFATAFAMSLSQPEEIGRIGIAQAGSGGGGMSFYNATANEGDFYRVTNKNNKYTFGRGTVMFDKGADALYIHYNVYQEKHRGRVYCGGKNIDNTVQLSVFNNFIYMINTDKGITLYPIRFAYGPESQWRIIGRRQDGKFVKYIDTEEITKRYFGANATKPGKDLVTYAMIECHKDTIVIGYDADRSRQGDDGEFRFKWDEVAQWFSVEQIVY